MLLYLIVLSASSFHKHVLLLALGGWGGGDHGSNDGKMYAATRSLIVENKKIYAEIFHRCFFPFNAVGGNRYPYPRISLSVPLNSQPSWAK